MQGGQAESLGALVQRLSATDSNVRQDAIFELSKLGPRAAPAVPHLIRILGDADLAVAEAAASALKELGEPALAALLQASQVKDAQTRRLAVTALAQGHWDRKHIVPALLRALRDKDSNVREEAVGWLRTARDPVALWPLIDVVRNDPDKTVRKYAVAALPDLGVAAKAAIPVLVEVLKKEAGKEDTESFRLSRRVAASLFDFGPDTIPSLTSLVQGRKQILPHAG